MPAWLAGPALYIILALAGSCAVLFGVNCCTSAQLDAAQQKNARLEADIDTAVKANGAMGEVLDTLKSAHADLIEKVKVSNAAITQAAEQADARATQLRLLSAQIRAQREEIYRAPSCQELARLDIAAACPALADSLRLSARRTRAGNGEDRGPDPGEAR